MHDYDAKSSPQFVKLVNHHIDISIMCIWCSDGELKRKEANKCYRVWLVIMF
ncbi:hypothetical protein HMP0015_0976 [Acinetobacter haemolyticus ATCC 19194]|uniref:Uncharacterized protein n=1 Tax=Acinetobacter haemolyticus ATCC 19194 TaxID=707232 RepID=D4XMM3_ACIHA|nr:hypothetical protein HMP0015_0976 [Acinetobacter haemolyticus ATCC 19194]